MFKPGLKGVKRRRRWHMGFGEKFIINPRFKDTWPEKAESNSERMPMPPELFHTEFGVESAQWENSETQKAPAPNHKHL